MWFLGMTSDRKRLLGPLARVGPNHLMTSDPEIFRHVLGARSTYERGGWFDCLRIDPHQPDLIIERDRTTHNALRAQMAAGVSLTENFVEDRLMQAYSYDGKGVEGFDSTIDENLDCWVKYIEENALCAPGATKEFDIARSIQWLLFDMVCCLCFGYPVGFVENYDDCYHIQKTLEERLPIVEKFAVMTGMNVWIKIISYLPLFHRVLPSSRDKDGLGAILGVKFFYAF